MPPTQSFLFSIVVGNFLIVISWKSYLPQGSCLENLGFELFESQPNLESHVKQRKHAKIESSADN